MRAQPEAWRRCGGARRRAGVGDGGRDGGRWVVGDEQERAVVGGVDGNGEVGRQLGAGVSVRGAETAGRRYWQVPAKGGWEGESADSERGGGGGAREQQAGKPAGRGGGRWARRAF